MSHRLAIVLAAGKGTRMQSDLPKVLCPALGRPMIEYVLDALEACGVERTIVVVGYEAAQVEQALANRDKVEFALQAEQHGTGHAVMMCREQLASHDGSVLILAGDSPLVQQDSLRTLLDYYEAHQPACLLGTLTAEDATGLGRIVRTAAGEFEAIVEHKDATSEQLLIREVNMSTYLFDSQALQSALAQLTSDNSQSEYYLTDCPGILKDQGKAVHALPVLKSCEALSINTVDQLAIVEAEMRKLGY